MKFHRIFNKLSLLLILSSISLPAYSVKGDFGGIWSDTLNFTHPAFQIRTGPKGNLKLINGQNFDVEEVHKGLKKSVDDVMKTTGKDHNIVVAGLTVIIRHKDNKLEAYYKYLQEEEAPIKPNQPAKFETLAFISGTIEKKYAPQGYKIIGPSQKHQPPALLEKFDSRLQRSVSPALKNNGETLGSYCQSWKKIQEDQLKKTKEDLLKEVQSDSHKSFYSLADRVKNILDTEEKEANAGFGSAVDSEQYLLSYLSSQGPDIIQPSSNSVFRFRKLFSDYRFDKLTAINKEFSDKLSTERRALETQTEETRTTKKMRLTIEPFTAALDQYDKNEEEIIGYIFHLHSTNELCCCCTFSIADEFFCKTLSHELTRQNEKPPFIFVTASASQMFDKSNTMRQGIGLDNKLDDAEYEVAEGIKRVTINSNILLQKLIK